MSEIDEEAEVAMQDSEKKSFSLQGFIDAQLSGKEDRDPTKCFSVSDMGSCMRKRIMKRMGLASEPFDERTYRLFAGGHLIHEHIQGMLEKEELLVAKELTIKLMGGELVGHCDAIIKWFKEFELHEYKTTHSRKLLYGDINKSYILQGLTYWLGIEKQYPQYPIKMLRVCLISRDDWLIKEVGYTLTNTWRAEIHKEMDLLWKYWQDRNKELPPEINEKGIDGWQCGYPIKKPKHFCQFIQHCPGKQYLKDSPSDEIFDFYD